MVRVIRGIIARKKRKKFLSFTRGSQCIKANLTRTVKSRYMKALSYSYRSRRNNRLVYRSLYVSRIRSYLSPLKFRLRRSLIKSFKKISYGYSRGQARCKHVGIRLNFKSLGFLVILDPQMFTKLMVLATYLEKLELNPEMPQANNNLGIIYPFTTNNATL